MVYMTFDGVAPRAKINHQRERRYMHANQLSDFIRDELGRGNVVPSDFFDSTCITPATEFMFAAGEQTQLYIEEKLKQEQWKSVKFIYSGSNTPGEGEHKIMDFLRGMQTHPELCSCIYSPDADMIILGLVTHLPNVIILRESAHRTEDIPPRGFACEKVSFDLIFLSILREYFRLEFPSLNLEQVVDDFILIVTFVGNDFVPTIPTFDINEGALSYLMDAYRAQGRSLQKGGRILWGQLAEFFKSFFDHEKQVLEKRIKDQSKLNRKRGTNHTKLFDISEHRVEGQQPPDSSATLSIIKESYYRDCFHLSLSDPSSNSTLRHHVQCYLTGIQWVMYYYYRGCSDWDWFYPQHYAPMLSDFCDLGDIMRVDGLGDVEFGEHPPYHHVEQLLMVFPPTAWKLIPEEYRKLIDDPMLADVFPKTVEIEHDILSAKATWSSVKVLLPFPDRSKIQQSVTGITESDITKRLFATHLEKTIENRHGEIVTTEIQPVRNPPFSIPERVDGDLPFEYPALQSIPGTCRITSDPGSDYLGEYRLPSVRYVLPQHPESPELDQLVGQMVFTGFPFRFPSLVEIVSYKTRVCPHDQAARLSSDYRSFATRLRRDLTRALSQEQGLEISPEISVILHVKRVLGYKKTLLGVREYEFDHRVVEVPVEICQRVPEGWVDTLIGGEVRLESEFPIHSPVVLLDEGHFGHTGLVTGYVQGTDFYPKGNIQVQTISCPRLSLCAQLQSITDGFTVTYHRIGAVSQRMQVPVSLIERFTQSVIVTDFSGSAERARKYEMGLNLRKDKERLCVPGATRWAYLWDQQTTEWEYSQQVADALEEYHRTFPELWDSVQRQPPNMKSYYAKDIFGYTSNHWVEIRKVGLWLMKLPTYRRKWASIKSQEAPEELVKLYVETVEREEGERTAGETVAVNPGLAYIPDTPPTPRFLLHPQPFSLGDRVLLLLPDSQSSPFSSQATVIATYSDTHLAVLLDSRIRNSAQTHPVLTVPAKFALNLTRRILGVNRGPKDYACVDFQGGSGFTPAFAKEKIPVAGEISRATLDTGAPSGDFIVVKGEDGLPIPLRVDYPYDLEKFEYEFPDPLLLGQRPVDVQLPEGFECKVLVDFVNK